MTARRKRLLVALLVLGLLPIPLAGFGASIGPVEVGLFLLLLVIWLALFLTWGGRTRSTTPVTSP